MPRPVNLERQAEREEAALEKQKAYREKRQKDAKAHHEAVSKAQQKRLLTLGQLVEDVWPKKSILTIARLLKAMSSNGTAGHDDAKRPQARKKETFYTAIDPVEFIGGILSSGEDIPPEDRDDTVTEN